MLHILIVEDEFIAAHYIKKILQQNGYKVVGIANSKESVFKFIDNDTKIDLILMDIKIKGKTDGIKLAKILRSYQDYAILFISAYSDDDYLNRAKSSDAIGYLVKPIQPNTLLSTIKIGMAQFYKKESKKDIQFCKDVFYNQQKQLIKNKNERIYLFHHEAIILDTLIKNRDKIISTARLEEQIYKDDIVKIGALRTQIWRLRKKLPSCVAIENVYNSGYRINY